MNGSNGERQLQLQYGTQNRAQGFYDNQMLQKLNPEMVDFIAKQQMVFISTADARGNCDTSFRGGDPGFVKVLNETTIVYPEYRGNGVYASLGNILDNPHIGLLFIDFFEHCIGLHVNGVNAGLKLTHQRRNENDPPALNNSLREPDRFRRGESKCYEVGLC